MKQIMDHVKTQPHTSTKTCKPSMTGHWTSKLFAILQARYAHKMASAYPTAMSLEIAIEEWGKGLAGFDGEDVKRGLDAWQESWPPSLPEFKKACKPVRVPAHREFLTLPKAKPDKKLGAKAFREMQEALR